MSSIRYAKPRAEPRRARDDLETGTPLPMGEHRVRSATARPSTWNPEARTVEGVISTGAGVVRRDSRGPFVERLDLSTIDPASLVGLPVIDGHATGSVRNIVGIITAARREAEGLVAVLRIGLADDAEAIAQRIAEGLIKNLSIGYAATSERESVVDGRRVKTVVPHIREISLVVNGADPGAQLRTAPMPDIELIETETAMPEADAQRIRSLGELADLPPSVAEGLIERGASVEEARTEIRCAMVQRSQATSRIRVVSPAAEDPALIVRRQTDALAYRMAGGELADDSRSLVDVPLRDMALASLQREGVSTRGMNLTEMFYRAGEHTTSDFSLIVSNAMNKVALDGYKAAESPLKTLCRQRSLPNFKESTAVRLGEMGRLEPLTESGEFKATTRAENGETLKLGTYGRSFAVSRQLLIDDDLNLLGDITRAIGEAAAQTESDLIFGVVTGNPKMSDGKAVFHATRGNIGTAGDITIAALTEARQALRTRTGLDGKTLVSATPKYLLVGADRETEAEAALSDLYATTVADVNVFSSKLTLLVEPRITNGSWFVFADPSRLAGLQFAYLSSAQGVQIQRSEAWDVLGSKWRAWLDFGAGWLDWRAAQFNAGA